jgi:hypothetical protein
MIKKRNKAKEIMQISWRLFFGIFYFFAKNVDISTASPLKQQSSRYRKKSW